MALLEDLAAYDQALENGQSLDETRVRQLPEEINDEGL
jgi:hypothetical protein